MRCSTAANGVLRNTHIIISACTVYRVYSWLLLAHWSWWWSTAVGRLPHAFNVQPFVSLSSVLNRDQDVFSVTVNPTLVLIMCCVILDSSWLFFFFYFKQSGKHAKNKSNLHSLHQWLRVVLVPIISNILFLTSHNLVRIYCTGGTIVRKDDFILFKNLIMSSGQFQKTFLWNLYKALSKHDAVTASLNQPAKNDFCSRLLSVNQLVFWFIK